MYDSLSTNPVNQQCIQVYQQKYGKAPDRTAALGYDSVMVIAQAIKQSYSRMPSKLVDYLHSGANWVGVIGNYQFDKNGELVGGDLIEKTIQNGSLLQQSKPPSADKGDQNQSQAP